MAEVLFRTQRNRVIEAYKAAKQDFLANTKPYFSTVIVPARSFTAAGASFIIINGGIDLPWFSYRSGEVIPNSGGFGTGIVSTPCETNLTASRSTNGSEDFVIEGCSARLQSVYMVTGNTVVFADADVAGSLAGTVPLKDPAALQSPPQFFSPANLEEVFYQSVAPHIDLTFDWEGKRTERIGTLDEFAEGGGNSYLRTNGEPSTRNRYLVPEGYLWRRKGQPDGELILTGHVCRPIVVPINLVIPPQMTVAAQTANIGFAVKVRLHGVGFKVPSAN